MNEIIIRKRYASFSDKELKDFATNQKDEITKEAIVILKEEFLSRGLDITLFDKEEKLKQEATPAIELKKVKKETLKREDKERHKIVTGWLIFMLIANILYSSFYFYSGGINNSDTYLFFGALNAINVFFVLLLFQWRKVAYFGICLTTIVGFIFNLTTEGKLIGSLASFVGLTILYFVLQTTKDGISAWENLE